MAGDERDKRAMSIESKREPNKTDLLGRAADFLAEQARLFWVAREVTKAKEVETIIDAVLVCWAELKAKQDGKTAGEDGESNGAADSDKDLHLYETEARSLCWAKGQNPDDRQLVEAWMGSAPVWMIQAERLRDLDLMTQALDGHKARLERQRFQGGES
jgi:hypothetical protein